jgi:hypothetical protein
MNRTTRLLAILLAAVIVAGGIYVAYESGFDNGAIAASAAGDNADSGTVVAVDRFRGPYGWHGGFGFFPFFPILFLFLIFGLIRPWRWGGGPGRGWNGPHIWGPPREYLDDRLNEWHKQAHNEDDADRTGS